ncbi:hypothetical protein PVAR5_5079 [Paecilomyces variotii No. 5]|uniref:Uncharacterized protein n=1 Tax=Byssochlamys spectabilis (strain No. 5 / NBRC 109023) TaxID=1356009 RepID=V5I1A4_BYSSN|nr:hypothetical protein PVAR5_5079 [Paecilomyces variotii No. 5]
MSTKRSSTHDPIKEDPYPPNSFFLDRYDPDSLSLARDGDVTHPTTSDTDEQLGYANRDTGQERDARRAAAGAAGNKREEYARKGETSH